MTEQEARAALMSQLGVTQMDIAARPRKGGGSRTSGLTWLLSRGSSFGPDVLVPLDPKIVLNPNGQISAIQAYQNKKTGKDLHIEQVPRKDKDGKDIAPAYKVTLRDRNKPIKDANDVTTGYPIETFNCTTITDLLSLCTSIMMRSAVKTAYRQVKGTTTVVLVIIAPKTAHRILVQD